MSHLHGLVRGDGDEAVRALRTQYEAVHAVRVRGQRPNWLVLPPHVEEVNVSCEVHFDTTCDLKFHNFCSFYNILGFLKTIEDLI